MLLKTCWKLSKQEFFKHQKTFKIKIWRKGKLI
ncbi:MAG: hypothetical protein MRERC_1c111 [Mycoplasmataceae bacterium RC_NB112A]|nr:MAG: hypothetical protein MRERC_1c111 [Mycoplasmataceae bacterium RC_NB112A]